MKTIKTLVFGGLLAGSMIFSTGAAMARDFDHHDDWSRSRYEWDRRADFRNNRETLEQLRAKRDYDATHHASRKKIAEDNQAIENLYNDMHDRRGGWRW
jgi:hypothetical protein